MSGHRVLLLRKLFQPIDYFLLSEYWMNIYIYHMWGIASSQFWDCIIGGYYNRCINHRFNDCILFEKRHFLIRLTTGHSLFSEVIIKMNMDELRDVPELTSMYNNKSLYTISLLILILILNDDQTIPLIIALRNYNPCYIALYCNIVISYDRLYTSLSPLPRCSPHWADRWRIRVLHSIAKLQNGSNEIGGLVLGENLLSVAL